MLKVLLVDDEPFIIQGLKVIIDWENEEFEIAGTASNGKEALQFLENENVDLVIADIRMPEMTGLELLETLRKDKKSDVYFVILSGYADFSYAQQAMQNDCTAVSYTHMTLPTKRIEGFSGQYGDFDDRITHRAGERR